jgi:hypothetical protein
MPTTLSDVPSRGAGRTRLGEPRRRKPSAGSGNATLAPLLSEYRLLYEALMTSVLSDDAILIELRMRTGA